MRGKLIDALLVLAALIAALWLAALVYHNRLGGHVEHPDAGDSAAAVPGEAGAASVPR